MELQGTDISQYEPVINRFFRLRAPSHEWTPLPEPDFGETIFSVSPFLNPVEPLHQPSLPVLPNPLKKPRLDTYGPPRSCPTEPEDNMVDLDELIHPGTDPPGNNTPFPDRLRSSMAFWESITQPPSLYHGVLEPGTAWISGYRDRRVRASGGGFGEGGRLSRPSVCLSVTSELRGKKNFFFSSDSGKKNFFFFLGLREKKFFFFPEFGRADADSGKIIS